MRKPRIAVVGASLAGVRTIRALRRKGFDGEIILIGDEGELPYDRPPLSKQFLTAEQPVPRLLEPEKFYDGIELHLDARAVGLSRPERSVHLEDGRSITADHVVIATGSRARGLPGVPDSESVGRLRSIADARRIRAALETASHMTILGGGFIGCEVAAAARARGVAVTIVEPASAPVVRGVGSLVGGAIAELHRDKGVDVRLGVTMASIEDDGTRKLVTLSDGTRCETDFLVVGIGAVPCVEWLNDSGLNVSNGVICDEYGSVENGGGHIWAAGDVAAWAMDKQGTARRIEHWTNAAEQATALAQNLIDGGRTLSHSPVPYVWSDQYEHKIQILGSVSGDNEMKMLRGSFEERRFALAYSCGGIFKGLVAFNMPQEVVAMRPLIASSAPMASVL